MTIKAIIWDLGGVLVRTEDHSPRIKLAEELGVGVRELVSIFFADEGAPMDRNPQVGTISAVDHMKEVAAKLGLPEEDYLSMRDKFFSGDVLDNELVDYIRSKKDTYHTALLSNAFDDLRDLLVGEWDIIDTFQTLVISGEVGVKKPDPAIYHLTLEKIGVKAEEAVFIDDMPHNIEAAEAAGIRGIRFESREQAIADLEKLLNE